MILVSEMEHYLKFPSHLSSPELAKSRSDRIPTTLFKNNFQNVKKVLQYRVITTAVMTL